MHGVTTNVYLRKMLEKPKVGLRTLSMKGSGVVFMHGEGISTPRVCHKGRQPLIECANHDFNIIYFPFYAFLCIFLPFMFFYIFVVDKGVSLAPMYSSIVMKKSDLRSSLGTEHWLSCFILFERLILVVNKICLRRWTFKEQGACLSVVWSQNPN